MVRSFVMSILLACFAAGIPAAQAQDAAAQAAPQWKDRAEYDAFMAIVQAAQAKDNNLMIENADKFLAAYPDSKQLGQVYQVKLGAYQAMNNTQKTEETANKLLELNPNDLRAILVLSYLFPRTVNTQDPELTAKLDKAEAHVNTGLAELEKLQKPANATPEQFEQQKVQTNAVLHETAGFVALQKKDYAAAAERLTKSLQTKPDNALGFYWLGLAYLTPKPPEYDKGMWAMARSVALGGSTPLPESLKSSTRDYLGQVYENRHGSRDGFDDLLAQATATPFPPDGFHVMTAEEVAPPEPEPVPEPVRELTVKIEELATFDDIQAYLQAGGQKEADTWELLKGATLPLPGKVVGATPVGRTRVLVAVSPELAATQPGKHDVELTLAEPLGKALAAGADVNFEGTLDSYTATPFLLKMIDGKVN